MVPVDSRRIARVLRYSGCTPRRPIAFDYRGVTFCARPYPERSSSDQLCNSAAGLQTDPNVSHNPAHATPASLHMRGLGCSPFARHYWGNRHPRLSPETLGYPRLLSFPAGTWMFRFPTFATLHLFDWVEVAWVLPMRVAPFGNPRINAC